MDPFDATLGSLFTFRDSSVLSSAFSFVVSLLFPPEILSLLVYCSSLKGITLKLLVISNSIVFFKTTLGTITHKKSHMWVHFGKQCDLFLCVYVCV